LNYNLKIIDSKTIENKEESLIDDIKRMKRVHTQLHQNAIISTKQITKVKAVKNHRKRNLDQVVFKSSSKNKHKESNSINKNKQSSKREKSKVDNKPLNIATNEDENNNKSHENNKSNDKDVIFVLIF